MNLSCPDLEALSARIDRELPPPEAARIDAHAAACPACAARLAELHETRRVFRHLPHPLPGVDLAAAILGRLPGPRRPAPRGGWRLWQCLPLSLAAAMTITLGVALGTLLVHGYGAQERPSGTLALFDPIPPGGLCIGYAACYPKGKL